MSIEEKIVLTLKQKKLKITFAESCTGGLAAARLVNVPDASLVFDAGFVTYANEAKTELVGVSPELIEKHGAVSREVAVSMAKGAAARAGADIGVGISGIAGPGGGTPEKPCGTVCFGFCYKNIELSFQRCFGDIGRNNVREKSVDFVFEKLAELLG